MSNRTPAWAKSQFWAVSTLLVAASKIIAGIVKNLFMIHGFRVKNLFTLHFFHGSDSKNSKERKNT